MKRRFITAIMVLVLLLAVAPGTTNAALNAVDPGPYGDPSPYAPYAAWYQDTNGRGLELCLLTNAPCLGPAAGGAFWYAAEAPVVGQGVDLRFISALEAAGGDGFARIRIVGDVPTVGTYTITHPYGVHVFEVATVDQGREIFFTEDIGIGEPFTGALKGSVGPFLVRVDASGNPSLITTADGTFIGDFGALQPVTGSPFGTNSVRVQGPGIDITTDQFNVSGKVWAGLLASPVVVDRTTYSRTAAQTQVDVFATSAPTATASFTPPVPAIVMGGDILGRFFGQAIVDPAAIPPTVDVTAENPPLNNSPTTRADNAVTDVVTITKVEYGGGQLVIEASSSDETSLPTLSFGASTFTKPETGVTQTLTVGLAIPPATVTVTSTAGGSDTEDVVVLP